MRTGMTHSNQIGIFDTQITEILEFHKGNAAPALFERYRISGENRDDFVAALIARLCILEALACPTGGIDMAETRKESRKHDYLVA